MRRLIPERKKLTQEEIKRRIIALAERCAERHEEPTYRCRECQDIGYILTTDSKHIVWSKPCIDCLKGQRIIEGDDRRREKAQETTKRKEMAMEGRGEDLPI